MPTTRIENTSEHLFSPEGQAGVFRIIHSDNDPLGRVEFSNIDGSYVSRRLSREDINMMRVVIEDALGAWK